MVLIPIIEGLSDWRDESPSWSPDASKIRTLVYQRRRLGARKAYTGSAVERYVEN